MFEKKLPYCGKVLQVQSVQLARGYPDRGVTPEQHNADDLPDIQR